MSTRCILLLMLTAASMTFGINEANAAVSVQVGTPNMSFSISDYQPAPPNVYIQNDAGRPYYVERNRRVYMEKKHHGKHYNKEKKHHEDREHGDGHDRHGRHDH